MFKTYYLTDRSQCVLREPSKMSYLFLLDLIPFLDHHSSAKFSMLYYTCLSVCLIYAVYLSQLVSLVTNSEPGFKYVPNKHLFVVDL